MMEPRHSVILPLMFDLPGAVRQNGTVVWEGEKGCLSVRTSKRCWDYAAYVVRKTCPEVGRHMKHVIRITMRTLRGEVGVSIVGSNPSDLTSEVLVGENETQETIDLMASDLPKCGGLIIRNGSHDGVESWAEIYSVETLGLPQMPPIQMSGDQVVAGFLAACDQSGANQDVVIYPDLATNISAASVRLVRLGAGSVLSRTALLQLVEGAVAAGFAVTGAFQSYPAFLAVRQGMVEDLAPDPRQWYAKLVDGSIERYLASVRGSYQEASVSLDESMRGALSECIRPVPDSVIFEAANACNLACPICPRNDRKIKDGLMEVGQAKRLVSDFASTGRPLIFYPHYLGETLIHPGIFEIIDHALKYPNIEVHLITNGILLDERRQDELLSRPIRNYNFSIHECDQIGQHGIPPDQAFSTRNVLRFLRKAVDTGKRNSFFVNVSMVPASFRNPALYQFRDYWLGVADAIVIYSYVQRDRTISDRDVVVPPAEKRFPCTAPWSAPVIAYDGSVLPCCWDYEHSMVMGNVFDQSFDEIWSGQKFISLRRAILAGDFVNHPTCARCEKWTQWLPAPPQVQMREFYFSSNGTYLTFGSLQVSNELLALRIAGLPGTAQWKHLPIYRKPKNGSAELESGPAAP
jgi:radical SAM protein with 4Fe4S-binding SPASM domain